MNQLSCQSCGSALQVDGFDRRLAVVHCSYCGVLFDLTKPRGTVDGNTDSITPTTANAKVTYNAKLGSEREADRRPVAAMPPGFSINEDEQLSISWSWHSASSMILLGFSVFWNLIVILQFSMAGSSLVQGVFVAIGLAMLYRAVAGVINTTTITTDENWLRVRHRPLPWFPAPTIDISSIEQLFVSEGYTKSKNGAKTPYYLLNAVLRDNVLQRLSNKLPDIEPALYLEQEFERVLHIRDRSVAGEVRGTTKHI